jgi:hypothetical protein
LQNAQTTIAFAKKEKLLKFDDFSLEKRILREVNDYFKKMQDVQEMSTIIERYKFQAKIAKKLIDLKLSNKS